MATSDTLPPSSAVPAFDNTLGALLVGGLVAMALWGITCMQTFTFFMKSSKDPLLFKCAVAFLWALDTFDSALNGHILYYYLVSNYLKPETLVAKAPVWSVIIHVAMTSISDFIIRSLFAQRFYNLSQRNILVTAWIMAVSLTDLVVGLVITVKAFGVSSFLALKPIANLMYLNFAAGTTSDLSVALGLCYLLWKSKTGFRKTDSLITSLMMYSVNTGMIVAVDATLGMLTYIIMPNNFIFLAFYLWLSKLYLNSYLATLNAREDLRERLEEPVSIHLTQLSMPNFSSQYGSAHPISAISEKSSGSDAVQLSVQTLVERKRDASASSPITPMGP